MQGGSHAAFTPCKHFKYASNDDLATDNLYSFHPVDVWIIEASSLVALNINLLFLQSRLGSAPGGRESGAGGTVRYNTLS
jgi:hypothetical protein